VPPAGIFSQRRNGGLEWWLTLLAGRLTYRGMSEQRLFAPLGRDAAWLVFFAVVLGAWLGVLLLARPGVFGATGHALAGHTHDGGFFVLWAMWGVMMCAMMLPTLVPTLRVLDGVAVGTRAVWVGLVSGYGAVWVLGAAGFAALQVLVAHFGGLSGDGAVEFGWATAGFLLVAGGWQFSRTKVICQDACRTPMVYFLGRWRAGFGGGARMGAEIGVACVG